MPNRSYRQTVSPISELRNSRILWSGAAIFVSYYYPYRQSILFQSRSSRSSALQLVLKYPLAQPSFPFDSLTGFYVSKIHCNRRVTVPPERANRLPSQYSQINTTIIRQEVQFNFSLYDILTTKKKRASRSRMYGENPFLTVNNKLFFNSCQSLILNFSEYRHWHF